MRKQLILLLAVALAVAMPAFGQHDDNRGGHEGDHQGNNQGGHQDNRQQQDHTPRANGGHVPPAPAARSDRHSEREGEPREGGQADTRSHVNNDHWYGHDRPDDPRFRISHPFAHGHFEHFGPTFRYNVIRVDRGRHRFWFPGGFYFEVASWDWAECQDWCWNCGDDFVIYLDPDHIGWYLLYNVDTGVYVHVQYLGG